jgi:hypothetical protein
MVRSHFEHIIRTNFSYLFICWNCRKTNYCLVVSENYFIGLINYLAGPLSSPVSMNSMQQNSSTDITSHFAIKKDELICYRSCNR